MYTPQQWDLILLKHYETKLLKTRDKKVLYNHQKTPLYLNSTCALYKINFKYASLPNLNFRSLQCSKNVCAKTLCRPGNTVYHSAFLRQMQLILVAYSQTNSCTWLTKEAILGQAASPLQQKILDVEPYFTSILLKQFLPASQVKLKLIVFSTCLTDWL